MNVSELQQRLRKKERELEADMTRTGTEARGASIPEPQNGTVSAENKESLFQESTSDWNVFTQVRDALQRIEDGTYGKCVECGSPIEAHRLDSVPWTPYCLHHQNRLDRDLAARPL